MSSAAQRASWAANQRAFRKQVRLGNICVPLWLPRAEVEAFLAEIEEGRAVEEWARDHLLAEIEAGEPINPSQRPLMKRELRRYRVWLPAVQLGEHLMSLPPGWSTRILDMGDMSEATIWASSVILDAVRDVPSAGFASLSLETEIALLRARIQQLEMFKASRDAWPETDPDDGPCEPVSLPGRDGRAARGVMTDADDDAP